MPELFWRVRLRDGRVLRQRDGLAFGVAVLPLAAEGLVQQLYLETHDARKLCFVDLDLGEFVLEDCAAPYRPGAHPDLEWSFSELKQTGKLNRVRPIFFRRVAKMLSPSGEVLNTVYVYAVGWQACVRIPVLNPGDACWHEEERNVKRIMYVHPDGKVVLA